LFLHCVHAIDDILRIRKELNAQQPCIWHGYRGNAQQLHQLLDHNFYFSFGLKYNTEALLACPLDRLLLETDADTQHPISGLYTEVANLRKISVEELIKQMHSNFRTLFLE
jgi:TatD DNase family protein